MFSPLLSLLLIMTCMITMTTIATVIMIIIILFGYQVVDYWSVKRLLEFQKLMGTWINAHVPSFAPGAI